MIVIGRSTIEQVIDKLRRWCYWRYTLEYADEAASESLVGLARAIAQMPAWVGTPNNLPVLEYLYLCAKRHAAQWVRREEKYRRNLGLMEWRIRNSKIRMRSHRSLDELIEKEFPVALRQFTKLRAIDNRTLEEIMGDMHITYGQAKFLLLRVVRHIKERGIDGTWYTS